MKYTVDLNDRPVYLQIYRQLRADIVGGAFAYGSKLPSKRLLAEELGVSTITTEHAYDLLCEEGYARTKRIFCCFPLFGRLCGVRQQTARAEAREKHRTQQARIFIIAAQQDDAQSYCGLRRRDT